MKPPVLKGWRDAVSTLWRILLVKRAPGTDVGQVTNQVPGASITGEDPKSPTHLGNHPREK